MKTSKILVAAAAAALMGLSSAADAAVTLDFEGSSQSASPGSTAVKVLGFYAGGTDSGGTSGTNYGITFANANFDSTSQFTQPSFNISSAIAYMTQSPLIFSSTTAFTSIAFDQFFFGAGNVVQIFSGVGGTGTLLASATYGQNCTPACTAQRQTLGSFGDARSVTISPNANGTGIDNLTIAPVPEPATWAMMLLGFAVVGFGMRRRRSTTNDKLRVRFAV